MPSDSIGPEDLFECRRCGDCCKGFGGTYLTGKDIEAISRYIGSKPEKFVVRYCSLSGTKLVLAQRSDGYCIFWDKICTIHPVKPRMCRKWPFIESILVDAENWLIMADSCPGIHTDVPVDAVQKYVKKKLAKNN
jgi:Fe-S-cluster containining protein